MLGHDQKYHEFLQIKIPDVHNLEGKKTHLCKVLQPKEFCLLFNCVYFKSTKEYSTFGKLRQWSVSSTTRGRFKPNLADLSLE